jgi:hypothetical protein
MKVALADTASEQCVALHIDGLPMVARMKRACSQ